VGNKKNLKLKRPNVKQSRAFLLWASWLQYQKSCDWLAEGKLGREGMLSTPASLRSLQLVLTGAAGTGKTTTVMVQEALLDFFCGEASMRKSAPTITAARLFGGNTAHALYKLPLSTLHGKRGKLSDRVLKPFRKKFAGARAQVIDEISMLLPNNFYQLEVRSRTAMRQPEQRFGGLATEVCGDFLQLPPVDGQWKSLAIPWEDVERLRREMEDEALPSAKRRKKVQSEDKDAQVREAEHRGGCELWRSFRLVVCLSLNMRSAGMLAQILQEMRQGGFQDATWEALQDRVVGVVRTKQGALTRITAGARDPRLLRPPFSNNATCYIVHRHVLRASQSYVNALQEAIQRRCRLYVITAIDEVKAADEEKFSLQVRWEALRIANLRRTRFLPGQLPLYVGMPVLLFGKACVHLALMNGCACVIEQIILAEEEPEFEDLSVGVPTQLVFMPAALILRAKDADWILPSAFLPPLPNTFDRRGLFSLLPTTEYFPLSLPGKGDLLIRRSQFSVVPASVRIVYNAQGLHVISWRLKLLPAYVYSIGPFLVQHLLNQRGHNGWF
jgi:hypothetical protein